VTVRAFRAFAALVVLIGSARASAKSDLLERMIALNAQLHSFSATLHAHVALSTFPFLSADIVATYYHRNPDFDKLVIASGLPAFAQPFRDLYAHIEPPSQWQRLFIVKQLSDDGTFSRFRLVPRTEGNVDRIDVRVDDQTATIASTRWIYRNGGWSQMTNRYQVLDGYVVVRSQTGEVSEPGYSGEVTSTLTNYTFNPPLPEAFFRQ
jgi:hypothetical protein